MIAFARFHDDALDSHADVVFPAEIYPEKEGTVTHPDGRVQRVRQALGRPGEVRPGWSVLAELCERLGAGTGALSSPMVTALIAEAVPFYAGLTLDEIGGDGVRWQDRDAASALPSAELSTEPLAEPPPPHDGLVLGAGADALDRARGRVLALAALPRHRPAAPGSPSRTRAVSAIESGDEIELATGGDQRERRRGRADRRAGGQRLPLASRGPRRGRWRSVPAQAVAT